MKKLCIILFFLAISYQLNAAPSLNFSGDVRAKWHSIFHDDAVHRLKTEINISLDYKNNQAWLKTKVKACTTDFKDSSFSVEKAFVGYNLLDRYFMVITIEGGRSQQATLFESKLQHDSHFNGLHCVYHFHIPGNINFFLNGGPHLIDSSQNHIGAIICVHCKEIGTTPFELKYSINHWGNHHDEDQKYSISQIVINYRIDDGGPYAAYLNNHKANSLANGFYFGYTVGSLKNVHQYQIDANVQLTQANAVPAWDFCGLKKGAQLKLAFSVTNNFSIQAKGNWDLKDSKQIIELSGIYTW
jgi:hypothetical protein